MLRGTCEPDAGSDPYSTRLLLVDEARVILHVNHLQKGLSAPASALVAALLTLVEDGHVDACLLPALRVHLDWIQYRANFREPVSARRATDAAGGRLALAELAVDLRRADPATARG